MRQKSNIVQLPNLVCEATSKITTTKTMTTAT